MEQTVLDSSWWTCKFDGTVSNDGNFCYWCGRSRFWAERMPPTTRRVVEYVNPRVHVVAGLNGRKDIVQAPRFYRLRQWLEKFFDR